MNGEWTFTDSRDDWSYEAFPTKEEAIAEARIKFDGSFFVAQLIERDYFYLVENVEEIDQ